MAERTHAGFWAALAANTAIVFCPASLALLDVNWFSRHPDQLVMLPGGLFFIFFYDALELRGANLFFSVVATLSCIIGVATFVVRRWPSERAGMIAILLLFALVQAAIGMSLLARA